MRRRGTFGVAGDTFYAMIGPWPDIQHHPRPHGRPPVTHRRLAGGRYT